MNGDLIADFRIQVFQHDNLLVSAELHPLSERRRGRTAARRNLRFAHALPAVSPFQEVVMERAGVSKETVSRALGEAVVRIWSQLPHDLQERLFEEAVTSQGESIRHELAVLLHERHPRTSDGTKPRLKATPPDRLER